MIRVWVVLLSTSNRCCDLTQTASDWMRKCPGLGQFEDSIYRGEEPFVNSVKPILKQFFFWGKIRALILLDNVDAGFARHSHAFLRTLACVYIQMHNTVTLIEGQSFFLFRFHRNSTTSWVPSLFIYFFISIQAESCFLCRGQGGFRPSKYTHKESCIMGECIIMCINPGSKRVSQNTRPYERSKDSLV